jgi:hypothetical protein
MRIEAPIDAVAAAGDGAAVRAGDWTGVGPWGGAY